MVLHLFTSSNVPWSYDSAINEIDIGRIGGNTKLGCYKIIELYGERMNLRAIGG